MLRHLLSLYFWAALAASLLALLLGVLTALRRRNTP